MTPKEYLALLKENGDLEQDQVGALLELVGVYNDPSEFDRERLIELLEEYLKQYDGVIERPLFLKDQNQDSPQQKFLLQGPLGDLELDSEPVVSVGSPVKFRGNAIGFLSTTIEQYGGGAMVRLTELEIEPTGRWKKNYSNYLNLYGLEITESYSTVPFLKDL